ncbi:MAG TPA: cytochrome c-type biogenesis CcmF C-terminal domain-containing protein [Acidobacteriaceae bacterium]
MPTFGSYALLLALALSGYTLLAGALALRQLAAAGPLGPAEAPRIDRIAETARRAGIASFFAVTGAAFALIWTAFTNDFTVSYILHHSNRALPGAYKFAALWSGQEGSLLLWAWLLAGYGLVLRLRHRVDVRLTAYASTILAGIQLFFLLLLNFAAPPFALVSGTIPADGFGLNPLLQYPEMVIHPPMLYLGYVGFAVPFAFALGALMMRYPGEKWIHITRRWTMVTWLFLTCGIFLGAHWAYSVLGWGGYWGWDPVENASLMPWLTGTAFLHSVMMQEKRGMMKKWNVWLIFATFLLTLLGTDLTRSGLVSSVHAFAQSSIGAWFPGFMLVVLAVCLFTFIRQSDHLQSEHHIEAMVSREASFLFNNWILLVACFTVLWGTLFPMISEYVQGNKVTVGAPWYNRIAVPMGILLMLLTGVGPLLAWRSASLRSLRRNLVNPCIVAGAVALAVVILGARANLYPWSDLGTFYSFLVWVLAAFVVTAILSEFLRGASVIARHTGQNLAASALQLTRRNTRRYGGYIIHFGVAVLFIGLAGSAFNQSQEQELGFHDRMRIGPYTLVCQSYTQDSNPNYDTEYALLDVFRGGRRITQMAPEKRFYAASQQPATMVANHSTLAWDLYVVYAGKNPDTGQPIIKVFLNPLVAWIWIGVLIVVAGTAVALTPNLSATLAASRARKATSLVSDREAVVAAGGR